MLHGVMTIAALAMLPATAFAADREAATGSVRVSGFVPSSCRSGIGGGDAGQPTCNAVASLTTNHEAPSGEQPYAITRISVSPQL